MDLGVAASAAATVGAEVGSFRHVTVPSRYRAPDHLKQLSKFVFHFLTRYWQKLAVSFYRRMAQPSSLRILSLSKEVVGFCLSDQCHPCKSVVSIAFPISAMSRDDVDSPLLLVLLAANC